MEAVMIYIDDWFSSKHIELMDAAEERGYLRLLLREAKEEDCGLPDDNNQLAVMSLLGPQWFRVTKDPMRRVVDSGTGSYRTSGDKIRDCFFSRNGRLYNERLLKEHARYMEKSAKCREAANTKWDRVRAEAHADAMRTHSGRNADASETHPQNDDFSMRTPCEPPCETDAPYYLTTLQGKPNTSASDDAGWFAQWWEGYWLHRGRKAAEIAFRKKVKTRSLFERIMAATKAQRPEMMGRPQDKRPYGATWLNGERWEDELLPLSAPVQLARTDAVKALAIQNIERTGRLL